MKMSFLFCVLSLAVSAVAGSTIAHADSTDLPKTPCHLTCSSGPIPVCYRICEPTN